MQTTKEHAEFNCHYTTHTQNHCTVHGVYAVKLYWKCSVHKVSLPTCETEYRETRILVKHLLIAVKKKTENYKTEHHCIPVQRLGLTVQNDKRRLITFTDEATKACEQQHAPWERNTFTKTPQGALMQQWNKTYTFAWNRSLFHWARLQFWVGDSENKHILCCIRTKIWVSAC